MIDTASEEWRAICEARHWLRKGYTTANRVDRLMATIAEQRGQASADALRQEMRRQWQTRKTWLEPVQ